MTYADKEFYEEKYLLGRKPVINTGFLFYARGASRIIDRFTFGRLKQTETFPESVQMCCCELAELLFTEETRGADTGGKTSERIGSYSVSFASPKEMEESKASRQKDVVMKWLANTGLCYQGV